MRCKAKRSEASPSICSAVRQPCPPCTARQRRPQLVVSCWDTRTSSNARSLAPARAAPTRQLSDECRAFLPAPLLRCKDEASCVDSGVRHRTSPSSAVWQHAHAHASW
jgi:hypothetical protein